MTSDHLMYGTGGHLAYDTATGHLALCPTCGPVCDGECDDSEAHVKFNLFDLNPCNPIYSSTMLTLDLSTGCPSLFYFGSIGDNFYAELTFADGCFILSVSRDGGSTFDWVGKSNTLLGVYEDCDHTCATVTVLSA